MPSPLYVAVLPRGGQAPRDETLFGRAYRGQQPHDADTLWETGQAGHRSLHLTHGRPPSVMDRGPTGPTGPRPPAAPGPQAIASCSSRATFRLTMSATTITASTVVTGRFVSAPIRRRRVVNQTRGTTANGRPKLRKTWDSTRILRGSRPMAMTTIAGSRLTPRRTNRGIR